MAGYLHVPINSWGIMAVSKKRRKKKKKKQTKTVTNSLKIFIFHTNEASI